MVSMIEAFLVPKSIVSRNQVKILYKPHEDGDDESRGLLKLKTRAPAAGFNLQKALRDGEDKKETGMNTELIKALFLNQIIILILGVGISLGTVLWHEGFDALMSPWTVFQWGSSEFDAIALSGNPIILGTISAIPALLFSNLIESSDRREFANINFSTIIMVLTLFGRRSSPPTEFIPEEFREKKVITTKAYEVLGTSIALSAVTGICEETVFRLLLPSLLIRYMGLNTILSLVVQSALFGIGHTQPGSPIKENAIIIALQGINGLWFGAIFLAFGLPTSMTAHAVFDFIVFYKTWSDANAQIEYADQMYSKPLPPELEKAVREALAEAPSNNLNPRIISFVRRLFFTFDFDKNKTLSLSEVRKGLSYQALQRKSAPPPQEQIDALFNQVIASRAKYSNAHFSKSQEDRLDLSDFIRLISLSTQQSRLAAGARSV